VRDRHIVLAEGGIEIPVLACAELGPPAGGVEGGLSHLQAALAVAWMLDIDVDMMRAGVRAWWAARQPPAHEAPGSAVAVQS